MLGYYYYHHHYYFFSVFHASSKIALSEYYCYSNNTNMSKDNTNLFPQEATTCLPSCVGRTSQEVEREKSISCLVEVVIVVMVFMMMVVFMSLDHLANLAFI